MSSNSHYKKASCTIAIRLGEEWSEVEPILAENGTSFQCTQLLDVVKERFLR